MKNDSSPCGGVSRILILHERRVGDRFERGFGSASEKERKEQHPEMRGAELAYHDEAESYQD